MDMVRQRMGFGKWLPGAIASGIGLMAGFGNSVQAIPRNPDQVASCDILIVGGGTAGTAAAYEGLLAGKTVCLTEITDWVGGQFSSQGTSALDEAKKMRSLRYFPRGYNEFRGRILEQYDRLNPGDCWVSASCFLPKDGHAIAWKQLQRAARIGKGILRWFPATVVKELEYSSDGRLITGAIAIQHQPAPGTSPLNTEPLSQVIEDAYRYESSARFTKQIIRLAPAQPTDKPVPWLVVEATETGEIIALADVPYQLGLDAQSASNPSSPVTTNDSYCTQGFTYTFAQERTQDPQPQPEPAFYTQYAPYFSYENSNLADLEAVFTYRRIWSSLPLSQEKVKRFGVSAPKPGDISMQNWTWGNDYRPGTAADNLIYTRGQLQQTGQLAPSGWMGGLRVETLRRGEENALAYHHWFTTGTTDSQLGAGVKKADPNYRLMTGLDSPMGTMHGLSKYPYMRESRRIIGRPSYAYPNGFVVSELDISKLDYRENYYREALPPDTYRRMWALLSGLESASVLSGAVPVDQVTRRTRSTIYPDSVGIAQYTMDFHPCMAEAPPEKPGNRERDGVRRAHGQAYPGQIPLRAMIPQKLDNLIVSGKNIANSTIAAAAYRVHSFEWSVGAAAGTTAAFALENQILPYQLVDELPKPEPMLQKLRDRLEQNNNPTAFPDTSIFNLDWEDWKVW